MPPISALRADAARTRAPRKRFPKVLPTRSMPTSASIAAPARAPALLKLLLRRDTRYQRNAASSSVPLRNLSGAGGDRGARGRCAREISRALSFYRPLGGRPIGRRASMRRIRDDGVVLRRRCGFCRDAACRFSFHFRRTDSRSHFVPDSGIDNS